MALPIFEAFVRILLIVNLPLNQTLLPDILALCETNVDNAIDSGSLCEGKTSFCTWLISRKLCRFLLIFSTGFTSLSVLLVFLCESPSLSLCMVFDSIWSNIDEVFSINSSANTFVFGDFNVHHKDWLT